MAKKLLAAAALIAVAAGALFWLLTAPRSISTAALPQHQPDLENGEAMFQLGGCANCHAVPKAEGDERLKLAGGLELATDFGTFRVPNISPDEATGIGGWSDADFVGAMQRGVSPDGAHYYPAFPYASYARMRAEDVLDLKAYLDTLPAVSNEVAGHDLAFPYNLRRGLGLWKRLYLSDAPVVSLTADAERLLRGRYLVEGAGHCGECHTPRGTLGAMREDAWLAGAPNPEGKGRIPNITPHADGVESWSEADLVYFFESGFTPEFDSVGGSMVAVQEELARLEKSDLEAIAAYLKAVPPRPSAGR
ncbi:c-type cytochrome [Afifella pfennigii]|uniref:c-type cytochrome n=1 Tax=Afifella pfennigii TaxID=209897 RepID=UPI00047B4B88|nr:cytochrome c [Afifella pfennigii]